MILILLTINEESRRARYVLIDLSICEEVIDLIGKCPAENCRGKVKIQTIFQKKKKKLGLSCSNLEVCD